MIHMVRHALAGSRYGGPTDDSQRPLDEGGFAQAEAIGVELAAKPVKRILSSPYLRCTQTVEPLGRMLGLPVQDCDQIAEGTHPVEAFSFINSLASEEGDSVLCSHGDVIPGVLWLLDRYGVPLGNRSRCKKASIWELHADDGRIVSGKYRHPRTFGAA